MIFVFALVILQNIYADELCQYSYTVWNNRLKISEGPFKVSKPYDQLLAHEKFEDGCSVCTSDQVTIVLSQGVRFEICKRKSDKIRTILEEAISRGFKIKSITGYRPSISKGPLDSQGRRTEFSRHAFGVALDINENHNGLYDQCIKWGPSCRLIKGGKYSPEDSLSLNANSPLVQNFRAQGFKWGGEIHGFQKDFMHFSPDGL